MNDVKAALLNVVGRSRSVEEGGAGPRGCDRTAAMANVSWMRRAPAPGIANGCKHCCIPVKLRWSRWKGGPAVCKEEGRAAFDIRCDFDGSAIEAN